MSPELSVPGVGIDYTRGELAIGTPAGFAGSFTARVMAGDGSNTATKESNVSAFNP